MVVPGLPVMCFDSCPAEPGFKSHTEEVTLGKWTVSPLVLFFHFLELCVTYHSCLPKINRDKTNKTIPRPPCVVGSLKHTSGLHCSLQ